MGHSRREPEPPPFSARAGAPASSAPPLRSRSGCLTALYVLLAVGAVLFVLAGVTVWLFLRSEQGQQLVSAAREGLAVVQEASAAPGTRELRAAGCTQALVIPSARLRDIAAAVGAEVPEDVQAGAGRMVLCQVMSSDPPPGCDEIARVYAGAVDDAPDRFPVVVQAPGRGGTVCQGIHAPDGTLLESLDSSEAR